MCLKSLEARNQPTDSSKGWKDVGSEVIAGEGAVQQRDLPEVAVEVWRHVGVRRPAAEGAGDREHQARKDAGRSEQEIVHVEIAEVDGLQGDGVARAVADHHVGPYLGHVVC